MGTLNLHRLKFVRRELSKVHRAVVKFRMKRYCTNRPTAFDALQSATQCTLTRRRALVNRMSAIPHRLTTLAGHWFSVATVAHVFVSACGLALMPRELAQAQEAIKHRVTVGDSATLEQALYMQLSPDGTKLAYVLGEEKAEIWVVATRRGNTPAKIVEGAVPTWSPDGKHLAYYSSRSGSLQLWLVDLDSRTTAQVTDLQGGIDVDPGTRFSGWYNDPLRFAWSPDGSKIVFVSQVDLETAVRQDFAIDARSKSVPTASYGSEPLVLTNSTPPEWTLQGVFRGRFGPSAVTGELANKPKANADLDFARHRVSELFMVDVTTHSVIQLTTDNAIYFNPHWSPDGKRIACASSEGRPTGDGGPDASNIYLVDIATRKKSALTSGAGDKRLPVWSPDGRFVAYFGSEHFGSESVWLISANGGRPLNMTESVDRRVADFSWAGDGRSIVFTYTDGVAWPIARVDVQSRKLTEVSGGEAAYRLQLTVARSGAVAWEQTDGSSQGVIWIRAKDKVPYVLVDLNPQIKEWELGAQEIVRWSNSRGDELEGILIKPIGYEAGRRYPLVVDGYPQLSNGFFADVMYTGQGLAARGYAVFYPNARTRTVWMNSFKSRTFDQASRESRDWKLTYDDVMTGVDTLIRRGIIDGDRMGLYGFSNGGAVVNALLTMTGRFKCAVSVAGALGVDWFLPFFLSTANPIVPSAAGATPWQDPDLYIELSPIFHLDKVTTPILLADGDLDGSILLTDIEMYNALRWLGKDVTFLRYPNEGHGFTGAALEDFWQRENAFLDKYLKPSNEESSVRH
jgi:dipeptidyl aminopeptidase/acylaminoacyl peptidase